MQAKSKFNFLLIMGILLFVGCQPTEQEQNDINDALVSQGCDIPPSFDGFSCKGKFVARSIDDINSYLSNYGLKNGNVKHLKIDFDMVAPEIQITSPCSITVRDNASLNSTTGSSCLVAKGNVKAKGMNFQAPNGNTTLASYEGNLIIDDGATINTRNLNMIGSRKAVIQNTATITAHDINMKSFGEEDDARVHIRHSSNVTANNIFLEAKRKATLGRDSLYNVSGTIRIIGEGPDDDSDNPEFATIWRGTTVNTNELIINSLSKTKVSGGITVNANRVELSGPACKIGKTAVFNAPVQEGNCFSGDHPTASLKVAKEERTGEAPHTVNFDASKSSDNLGIVSYEWKVGELETLTTTEPTLVYTFNTPGVYKVRLKVTDTSGLVDYRTRKITVTGDVPTNTPPIAIVNCTQSNLTVICSSFGSSDDKGITSYSYLFSDGTVISNTDGSDVTHTFLVAGNQSVALTLADAEGETGTADATFLLNTNPVAAFNCTSPSPQVISCDGGTSSDVDGIISTYEWSVTDGSIHSGSSFTHQLASGGDFQVSLTITDDLGGQGVNTQTVSVLENQAPLAVINCQQNSLEISCDGSLSTDNDGSVVSYSWLIDGQFFDTASVSYQFATLGEKSISLTVTDNLGASQTENVTLTLSQNQAPLVSFSCQSESPHSISCDASGSNDVDGTIEEYNWQMGDGTALSGVNISHLYSVGGTKTITLTLMDDSDNQSSLTLDFSVIENIPPVATFSCTSDAIGQVSCNASESTDSDGSIVSYSWDMGDGTELSGPMISHEFENGGEREIVLTVIDNLGETTSIFKSVDVMENIAPIANFECSILEEELTCDASSSSDQDGTVSSYTWTVFSEETLVEISSGINYVSVISELLNPEIMLVVEDNLGKTSSLRKSINLAEPLGPKAYFKYMAEEGEVYTWFFGSAGDAPIVSGVYEFVGTGVTGSIFSFYPREELIFDPLPLGVYELKLTLTDAAGLTDSFSHTVDLTKEFGLPFVDFSLTQNGANSVFLDGVNSFDPYEFLGMTVDWGDGSPNEFNEGYFFNHQYPGPGSYTVTVSMTNDDGVTSSKAQTITVDETDPGLLSPVANFEHFSEIENVNYVRFLEQYSGSPNGEIISYMWDFGDGSTGFGSDVIHFYEPGVYEVTLTVVDFAGESNSQTQIVRIFETGGDIAGEIECLNDITPGFVFCNYLVADSSNSLSRLEVDWEDGDIELDPINNNSFQEGQVFHEYKSAGVYNIKLSIENERGGGAEFLSQVDTTLIGGIYPIAISSCFVDQNSGRVNCNSFGSSDPNNAPLTYFWDMGDGTILEDDGSGIEYFYNNGGEYKIELVVTNSSGYFDKSSSNVFIPVGNQQPLAIADCQRSNLKISCDADDSYDPDGEISEYKWVVEGIEYTSSSFEHTFQNTGLKEVILTVTDDLGRSSLSLVNELEIFSFLALFNTNEESFQTGISYEFFSDPIISPNSSIESYSWKINGVEVSTQETLLYAFPANGSYLMSLTLVNNFGTTSVAEQEIIISQTPVAKVYYDTELSYFPGNVINLTSQGFVDEEGNQQENSYDPDGSIVGFKWYSPEGELFSNSSEASYEFENAGPNTFTLEVEDSDGAVNKVDLTVNVDFPKLYLFPQRKELKLLGSNINFFPEIYSSVSESEIVTFSLSNTNIDNLNLDSTTGQVSGEIQNSGELFFDLKISTENEEFVRRYLYEVPNEIVVDYSTVISGDNKKIGIFSEEDGIDGVIVSSAIDDRTIDPSDIEIKKYVFSDGRVGFRIFPGQNIEEGIKISFNKNEPVQILNSSRSHFPFRSIFSNLYSSFSGKDESVVSCSPVSIENDEEFDVFSFYMFGLQALRENIIEVEINGGSMLLDLVDKENIGTLQIAKIKAAMKRVFPSLASPVRLVRVHSDGNPDGGGWFDHEKPDVVNINTSNSRFNSKKVADFEFILLHEVRHAQQASLGPCKYDKKKKQFPKPINAILELDAMSYAYVNSRNKIQAARANFFRYPYLERIPEWTKLVGESHNDAIYRRFPIVRNMIWPFNLELVDHAFSMPFLSNSSGRSMVSVLDIYDSYMIKEFSQNRDLINRINIFNMQDLMFDLVGFGVGQLGFNEEIGITDHRPISTSYIAEDFTGKKHISNLAKIPMNKKIKIDSYSVGLTRLPISRDGREQIVVGMDTVDAEKHKPEIFTQKFDDSFSGGRVAIDFFIPQKYKSDERTYFLLNKNENSKFNTIMGLINPDSRRTSFTTVEIETYKNKNDITVGLENDAQNFFTSSRKADGSLIAKVNINVTVNDFRGQFAEGTISLQNSYWNSQNVLQADKIPFEFEAFVSRCVREEDRTVEVLYYDKFGLSYSHTHEYTISNVHYNPDECF